MQAYFSPDDVRFILAWTLATTAAAFLSVPGALLLLVYAAKIGPVLAEELWVGGTLGFLLGSAQWLVLRRRVKGSGWWTLASLAGGLALGAAALLLGQNASSQAAFVFYGGMIGVCEWLVLRGRVPNAWYWMPLSGASWLAGSLAMAGVDLLSQAGGWPFGEQASVALMYAAFGLLAGAISGMGLARMTQNEDGFPGLKTGL